MEQKAIKTIKDKNLIQNGDKIVVAVSGGPDSMALVNVLKNLNFYGFNIKIVVAHINHMLRQEADNEQKYVEKYCKLNKIECFVKKVDVSAISLEDKRGVEETARKIRYEFFDEVLGKTNSNKIAIAHNKNDNVETVIMHLFRGTGINGLKGIDIKRDKYIRPLMECSREEIEKYCKDMNLEPKIDKSNFENTYTRNKIRNVLIPMIKEEFNPNIIESITRLSDIVNQQEEYINKQAKLAYNNIVLNEENENNKDKEKTLIQIDLKLFNKEENIIKSKIIIHAITNLFGNCNGIEKIHIDDIIKLCAKNEGNKYLTPNKNIKVLVKDKKIYFTNIN